MDAPSVATRLRASLVTASPRRLVGAEGATPGTTVLSVRRYAAFAAIGLVLSALQLGLLPRWLSEYHFGLVVLAISATQAALQLGDLGFARLAIDATVSADERARRRLQGYSVTILTTAVAMAVLAAVAAASDRHRTLAVTVGLGALAGALVAADKFRAAEREVAGDQVSAAGLNLLWTNVPKAGLLVGAALFADAPLVLVVAVAAGLACAPQRASLREAVTALGRVGLWGYPLIAIVGAFVLMWADTYFLTAHIGVSAAAGYEALYRILGACTYVFLPWISVATSRVSVEERHPLRRPLALALATTSVTLAASVVFVYWLAPDLFPHIRLPREAVPGLIAFYLLMPVSFCLGSALYVRAGQRAVTSSTSAAVAVCLAGHTAFTLRGGPAEAAAVDAVSLGVAVVLMAFAYRRSTAASPGGGLPQSAQHDLGRGFP